MNSTALFLLGKTLTATAASENPADNGDLLPGTLIVNLSKADGNSYRLGLPVMVRADKPTKGIGSTGEYGSTLPSSWRYATLTEAVAFIENMTEKGLQRILKVFAD